MNPQSMHPLRRLILQATPDQRRELALALLTELRKPGRPGVFAAASIAAQLGEEHNPTLLAAAWAADLPVPSWTTLLIGCWVAGSSSVVTAARDRTTLREWFGRAQLHDPYPFLQPYVVAPAALPERVRLYRGGSRDRDVLMQGFSWTFDRHVAAFFATWRHVECSGWPSIITTEVTRDQVAMVIRSTPTVSEVVLLQPPEHPEVDPARPNEIFELAKPIERERIRALCGPPLLLLSREGEAGWNGWAG